MVNPTPQDTTDKPCAKRPDHLINEHGRPITRRRFLLTGALAGTGLFLAKFLPPLPGLDRLLPSPAPALASHFGQPLRPS